MRHAFIAERIKTIREWLIAGSINGDGLYFSDSILSHPFHQVRCKWSGRVDFIHLITHESHVHGHRFDGQCILLEDTSATTGLFMYVKFQLRPISRSKEAEDEETLFWHWANEAQARPSDDRPCFVECIDSMLEDKKRK